MRLSFLAGVLAIHACATTQQSLIVTGEVLDGAGHTFVSTNDAMVIALKFQRITPQQYADWRAFVTWFKPTYDMAVSMWRTAVAQKNAKLEAQVTAILEDMVDQLGSFSVLVLPQPPKAAP